jgi:hypothetical protein
MPKRERINDCETLHKIKTCIPPPNLYYLCTSAVAFWRHIEYNSVRKLSDYFYENLMDFN